MERRNMLKAAVLGSAVMVMGKGLALAKEYFPTAVDEALWQGINLVKNPTEETELEKLHSPVIKAPEQATAEKEFPVEVGIGRIPHPMGPTHWIESMQLSIGNEPAGNVIFRSHGYVQAKARFNTILDKNLKGKTVSLVVQIKCNLHGIWQNSTPVKVL